MIFKIISDERFLWLKGIKLCINLKVKPCQNCRRLTAVIESYG